MKEMNIYSVWCGFLLVNGYDYWIRLMLGWTVISRADGQTVGDMNTRFYNVRYLQYNVHAVSQVSRYLLHAAVYHPSNPQCRNTDGRGDCPKRSMETENTRPPFSFWHRRISCGQYGCRKWWGQHAPSFSPDLPENVKSMNSLIAENAQRRLSMLDSLFSLCSISGCGLGSVRGTAENR